MIKKFFLFIIFPFLTSLISSCASDVENLTREDEKEIIKCTLEIGLVEGHIPDFQMLNDTVNIILTAEDIDPLLIPKKVGDKKILLCTRDELQKKADKEGDFMTVFVSLPVFEDTVVLIDIGDYIIKSKDSDKIYLCGGGFGLKFKKIEDKWVGKVYVEWIS